MSMVEVFENPGQFTLPFRKDTPDSIRATIAEFGHIVVLPQGPVHPAKHDEADLLAAARYAGVVLTPQFEDEPFEVWGQGMVWWLGTTETGPIIFKDLSFEDALLSEVVDINDNDGIIPFGLTQGTITDTDLGTKTFEVYDADFSIEAFRMAMLAFGAHFRVNPDGSVDACSKERDDVYVVTSPTVVAIRRDWGSDPTYVGIEAVRTRTRRDATRYATRTAIIDNEYTQVSNVGDFLDRDDVPYYAIDNSVMTRTARIGRPNGDATVDVQTYMAEQLAQHVVEDTSEIDLNNFELVGGNLNCGDFIFVFDPPTGFVDTDNEIVFRGQRIWPKKIRVLETDTPFTEGMGVYYRPSGPSITSADWVYLGRWVDWEATW